MTEPFQTIRQAALALLNDDGHSLNRKCGQFIGQLAVDPSPLSAAQAKWLGSLLEKAGLPPLAAGGER